MTCKDEDAGAGGTGRGGVARFSLPGPGELFLAFLGVGLSGFGGVLPFARRMLVEQKRWLTPLKFTELLSVAQFLRSEEHTSELQSLMRLSYAVFCLKKKTM